MDSAADVLAADHVSMTSRIPVPEHLLAGPFGVGAGLAAGLGEKRLRGADLSSPFRGVRVAGPGPATPHEIVRARAVRLRDDLSFSHTTAALLWGIPIPLALTTEATLRPHVIAVRPATPPDARDIVGHTVGVLLRQPVHLGWGRVTSPLDTWGLLSTQLALPDLVAAGDFLVSGSHPLACVADLRDTARAWVGRPGAIRLAKAVDLVREGPLSRPESHARLVLIEAGLPEPDLNGVIVDARGDFLAMGDFVWRRERLLAEYEGDYHRTDAAQFRKDISRRERVEDNGWRLTRFTRENLCVGTREFLERMSRRLDVRITTARMARAIALAGRLAP